MDKKVVVFLFTFVFGFFLLSSLSFSADYNLSGEITIQKTLHVNNTYRVVGDLNVTGTGYFLVIGNNVKFICDANTKIFVNNSFSGLFYVGYENFELEGCNIEFMPTNSKTAIRSISVGNMDIKNTTFNNANTVIEVSKVKNLNISGITLTGNTNNFVSVKKPNSVSGNITISQVNGDVVGLFLFVNEDVMTTENSKIELSGINGSGSILINNSNKNIDLNINNSNITGIALSNLKLENIFIDSLTAKNILLNNITNNKKTIIQNSTLGQNSPAIGGGRIVVGGDLHLALQDNTFYNAKYAIQVSDGNIYFRSLNNTFNYITDTAYYFDGVTRYLEISEKALDSVPNSIYVKDLNGTAQIINGVENEVLFSRYSNITFDKINSENFIVAGTFANNKMPKFKNCFSSIVLWADLTTNEDMVDFIDTMLDNSCKPYFITYKDSTINNLPFWAFNGNFSDEELPDPTRKITDDDADKFSVIMGYDINLDITGISAEYIKLTNSSLANITDNEIENLELNKVSGSVKNNTINTGLLLLGKNTLQIYNNKIEDLDCDDLTITSDIDFNTIKKINKKNIFEEYGLGGNWWSGFSDSKIKCKNDNNDAFCDSPFVFKCNNKNYTDYLPLIIPLAPVVDNNIPVVVLPPVIPPIDNSCASNSECLNTEYCKANKCTLLNCPSGELPLNHACVDCTSDSHCLGNESCKLNKCVSLDCLSTEEIKNHACVKKPIVIIEDLTDDINTPITTTEKKSVSDWVKDNKLIAGVVGGVVALLIIILIVVVTVVSKNKPSSLTVPKEQTPKPAEKVPEESPPVTEELEPKVEEKEEHVVEELPKNEEPTVEEPEIEEPKDGDSDIEALPDNKEFDEDAWSR